jgi:NAD+ kinase
MRIAIYGNTHQADHLDELARFFASLASRNVWIAMEAHFYDYLQKVLPRSLKVNEVVNVGDDFSAALALSIGGDGTFLRTARWVADREIPIVGINTGHLGYLADVHISEVDSLFDDFHNGRFKTEARSLIQVELPAGAPACWPYALNEVAFLKKDTSSMLTAHATINGEGLTSYIGDGLIVSTPTGSTGYNLSVGGPIIEPTSANWVLSPIAPHSLTMRPLVVNDNSYINVTTDSRAASSYLLSLDGYSISLPVGSTVKLRRAPFVVRVVLRVDHNFACALRQKLLWGMDQR